MEDFFLGSMQAFMASPAPTEPGVFAALTLRIRETTPPGSYSIALEAGMSDGQFQDIPLTNIADGMVTVQP